MSRGINGGGKMDRIKNQRTMYEVRDSLELLSIRDLERLAVKSPSQSQKVVTILGKKFKKNETHLAAKNALICLSLSKDSTVANLAKRALVGLEEAWSNKKVNLDGPNITTFGEFKKKKIADPQAQKKTSNKKNKSRRYR